MAGGLGLAASVIAVLQLTGSIVSLTYHCGWDMWDAKGDSDRLRVEVITLQKLLQEAEKLVTDDIATRGPGAPRFPALEALLTQDSNSLARKCAKEVSGVQKDLLPPWTAWNNTLLQQSDMGRGLFERAKWPLKKKRLESALEGIGRLQDAVVEAMAIDTSRTTVDIKTMLERMDTSMSSVTKTLSDVVHTTDETHDNVLVIRSTQEEEAAQMAQEREREAAFEEARRAQEERETILQRLDTRKQLRASQYAKYADLRNQRDKQTSRWLLDGAELKALLRPQAPGLSTLWLKGSAGCGKTMLSVAVLEHIEKNMPDAVLAYFFFDINSSEAPDSEAMLRSLAAQLVSACDAPLPAVITKFAAEYLTSNGDKPPVGAVLQLLENLVQHLVRHAARDVIIVLDALDECTDLKTLLQHLGCILQWDLPLRLFMASHDLPSVTQLLETNNNASATVVSADSDESSVDIELFVRHQLEANANLMAWPTETKEKIYKALASGAGGMFRWVICQIEMLRDCDTEEDVEIALASLPITLAATYSDALRRVPKMKLKRTLRVLLWLLVGVGQALSPEATSEFLAVDLNDPAAGPRGACYFQAKRRIREPQKNIPLLCTSLIGVHRRESRLFLKLAHSTVREYLCSDAFLAVFRTELSSLFAAWSLSTSYDMLEVAHAYACKTLLGYVLSWREPEDQFNKDHWPLASDAVQYWPHHLRLSSAAEIHVRDFLFALFELPTEEGVDVFANYVSVLPIGVHTMGPFIWTMPYSRLRLAISFGAFMVTEKVLTDQLRDDGLDAGMRPVTITKGFARDFCMKAKDLSRLLSDDLDKTLWNFLQPFVEIGAADEGEQHSLTPELVDRYEELGRPATNILPVLAASLPGYAFFAVSGWDSREDTACLCPPDNQFAAACLGGQAARAVQMIEAGEVDTKQPLWTKAGWGVYPLFLAIFAGESAVAAACLNNGAAVDQVGDDTSFFRPMSVAVWAGRLDLVVLLVEHGAAINAVCSMYGTPLQTAVFQGHHTVVEYLLSQPGIDVKQTAHQSKRFALSHIQAYWSPLEIAVSRDWTRVAKLLLAKDPEAAWVFPRSLISNVSGDFPKAHASEARSTLFGWPPPMATYTWCDRS